jgi:hypothetical protein
VLPVEATRVAEVIPPAPTPVAAVLPVEVVRPPEVAIPTLDEIPVIGMPLAELVERLPRTGGAPGIPVTGLISSLGAILLAIGASLRFRK